MPIDRMAPLKRRCYKNNKRNHMHSIIAEVPNDTAEDEIDPAKVIYLVGEEWSYNQSGQSLVSLSTADQNVLTQEQIPALDVYDFEEEESPAKEPAAAEVSPVPAKKIKRRSKGDQSYFTCKYCTFRSYWRYLLVRHMKSHSTEKPHKCEICDRGFKTPTSLQNHKNVHTGTKPHTCKHCDSTFTTSGELVRHVRYKHTHEKPHKCTECDYASVELSKLRRHVRCHSGERPYQCPHCTYAAADMFKLKRHLRTHTGEKPYKCDSCSMCFTQSNSLKAHRLIHNVSENPAYACEFCPAKYRRKTNLRIHVQKLHTSDKLVNCKRCGKFFPDRYSCNMHNKNEKCYKCDLCQYSTTVKRQLKSHLLKHTHEKPSTSDDCNQTARLAPGVWYSRLQGRQQRGCL